MPEVMRQLTELQLSNLTPAEREVYHRRGSVLSADVYERVRLAALAAPAEDQPRGEPPNERAAAEDSAEEKPPVWADRYPWPKLHPDALHGLAGDMVQAFESESEADPAAMLFTILAVAGSLAGPTPYANVHDDRHPARLFVAIVGLSTTGAKGTGWATVRPVFRLAAPTWFAKRIQNGFGSGEAIVKELQGDPDDENFDPRLCIFDVEFAKVLAVNARENSTSSGILRSAYDGQPLACKRSKDGVVAPLNHHISVIGHITPGELRANLAGTELTNGFANRFLYVCSKRSKKLPEGGNIPPAVISSFAKQLATVTKTRSEPTIERSSAAKSLWAELYYAEEDRPGLIGALTARWAPIRLRLSNAFAILDGSRKIEPEHIRAAEACWQYSVASVEHTFGPSLGDKVADALLKALKDAYPKGLTGREQSMKFGRNESAERLAVARHELEKRNLIRTEQPGKTGGRTGFTSFAIATNE